MSLFTTDQAAALSLTLSYNLDLQGSKVGMPSWIWLKLKLMFHLLGGVFLPVKEIQSLKNVQYFK